MAGTHFDGKAIYIDPYDFPGMVKLMDMYKEFPLPWAGTNDEGENILVSVNKDNITVDTFQNNGHVRQNTYWRDGVCEELFKA